MSDSLKQKTAKGLYWGSISSGMQQLLTIIFGIVIARILTEADYGMVSVLSIFTAVAATIQEGGFTAGLINRREIKHEDYNAVFWLSSGLGVSMYIILFFCAPLIASFFKAPALVSLSRVLFLLIPAGSLGIAHNALMLKELKMKERAIISIGSLLVSCSTGIVFVLLGYGYWGLVVQMVVQGVISTLLRWYFSSWKPNFNFNFQPVKEMFPFSVKLALTGFVTQINANILSVFFGRFYTKSEVGEYSQGNKWATLSANFINTVVSGIVQPVLIETGADPSRQKSVFRKLLRFVAFISFPLMLGLAFVAPELIVILITDKWLNSIFIMQLVCIWGAFLPVNTLYTQLIIAHGKSNIYFWNTFIMGLTQIVLLLYMHTRGMTPMIIAFLIINFLWLGIWHYWGHKLIGLKIKEVVKDMAPYLLISGIALGCSYFISLYIDNIYWRCIQKIIVAGGLYLLIAWKMNSVILKESVEYLLKKQRTDE
jgi:O-antigen/teichoic acid export membrane protein